MPGCSGTIQISRKQCLREIFKESEMAKGSWAYIRFVERPSFDWQGRPVDPGYGVDEGGYPDQGLPGGRPPHVGNRPPGSWEPPLHPGQGLPHPGRPVDPGWGVEDGEGPVDPGYGWGGGERPGNRPPGSRPPRPGHGLPTPPSVWPKPPGGGLPVDPDWGVGSGDEAGQLPIYPMDPAHPDNELPQVPGVEPPPVDAPPGTIWPPLPPEIPAGKAIVLAGIVGVGYRYVVVEIPVHPDQGLPETDPPAPQPKK